MAATLAAAAPRPIVTDSSARWRRELAAGRAALAREFASDPQPARLLSRHARLVDRVIRGLWQEIGVPSQCALIAVGGYGRGQLFPYSDVDVLILLSRSLAEDATSVTIERFIGALWDTGLEVAHSVRTIDECESEMTGDITIRTSLLERRLLAGSQSVY